MGKMVKKENASLSTTMDFKAEVVSIVKDTICKNLSNTELMWFLYLCKQYDLDPLANEIYAYKDKDGALKIIISIYGYFKIARRHKEFAGIESDVIRKGDTFKKTPEGIIHEYGENRGEIIGAYAIVYRKDWEKPVIEVVDFKEYYNANSKSWQRYPSAMIKKVAESHALRRAFGINFPIPEEMEKVTVQVDDGIEYIEETGEVINIQNVEKNTNQETNIIDTKTSNLLKTIEFVAKQKNINVKQIAMKKFNKPIEKLNFEEARELYKSLI